MQTGRDSGRVSAGAKAFWEVTRSCVMVAGWTALFPKARPDRIVDGVFCPFLSGLLRLASWSVGSKTPGIRPVGVSIGSALQW